MASLIFSNNEKHNCGIEDRALGGKYINTVVAKEDSWILAIPEQDFLISLHTVMEEKVKKFMEKLKHIPCFRGL